MTPEERRDFAIEQVKKFDEDHHANVDKGWRRLSAITEKHRDVVGEIAFFEDLQKKKYGGEVPKPMEVRLPNPRPNLHGLPTITQPITLFLTLS